MPSGETILALIVYLFVILIFLGFLWLSSPKNHYDRFRRVVGWLAEKNHPKHRKPKKY